MAKWKNRQVCTCLRHFKVVRIMNIKWKGWLSWWLVWNLIPTISLTFSVSLNCHLHRGQPICTRVKAFVQYYKAYLFVIFLWLGWLAFIIIWSMASATPHWGFARKELFYCFLFINLMLYINLHSFHCFPYRSTVLCILVKFICGLVVFAKYCPRVGISVSGY